MPVAKHFQWKPISLTPPFASYPDTTLSDSIIRRQRSRCGARATAAAMEPYTSYGNSYGWRCVYAWDSYYLRRFHHRYRRY
jgi:hypothetical protein